MMKAGELRHRITLQKPVYTQNQETGAMDPEFVEVAKLWAAIEPLSARDLIAAKAQQSKVVARIKIRYREDIAANMRIEHRGKIYAIEGILPDKESGREFITLPVSEGVALS